MSTVLHGIQYAVRPSNKTFSIKSTGAIQKALGGHAQSNEEPVPEGTNLLVHWGFSPTKALRSAIEQRIPYVILDRGYFEPTRVDRVSVSLNGHGNLAVQPDVSDLPERWHPPLQPWKPRAHGNRVYVLGQVHHDKALRGLEVPSWMNRVATEAVEVYGMPVVKREHPRMYNPWDAHLCPPLDQTFHDMHVAITFTSTAATQCVIAGIPTVALHEGNPAWDVCSHSIAQRVWPDREEWIHGLSHREYDLINEPDDGKAVAEYILRGIEEMTERAKRGEVDTP